MIKVTVTFKETKPTRIDALLKEYEVASNIAKETKQEIAPIIKEVGLAKHAAIMKQLKPIMEGMKKLSYLKDTLNGRDSGVKLSVYYQHPGVNERKFVINYSRGNSCERFDIKHCIALSSYNDDGDDFKDTSSDVYGTMFGADKGIVTHWNQLGIIDKLNKELERIIQYETAMAMNIKKITERQLNNLINN